MKLKAVTASMASMAMIATFGLLMASPAGATAAGTRAAITIERPSASATARLEVPDSFASTCTAAAKSRTFTAATRLDWCAAFAVVVTLIVNNEPTGTATIDQFDYASWKVSSRTWNLTNQIFSEVAATGDLEGASLTVGAVSTCPAGCKVTSNRVYVAAVPVTPADVQKNVGVDSPGTATVTARLKTEWTYMADGVTAVPPISKTTVGVRCDSRPGLRYPSGCANPSFTPTYVLSSARYPAVAKFDKAQLARHPSWATLARVSPRQAVANRRVACRGFKKRNRTDSCDEFPYASTSKGGAGAAQEHVNISENKAQGANLGAFYNANRLFYGDKFHVKVR